MKTLNISKIFWGLAILLVGLLFLAQNLGFNFGFSFWRYLPALLILLGIIQLVVNGFRGWLGSMILIIVGSLLLLSSLNIVDWNTFGNLIWPSILILIGLSILLGRGSSQPKGEIVNSDSLQVFSAFGGQERIVSPSFSNADLTTLFGGIKLDLRNAAITEPPAQIQVSAIFGGVEILVPEDWQVQTNIVSVFGGSDDKRHANQISKETVDLIISGSVIFGGFEIKS
jgi:predicted membrane protein